ncbi:unnamed protein product [Cylicostephanus goldi]|uniref:Uncharacterized protein n=1 Tax=Cylicostephanus goldi TaxID=71465 RepID=A0A3P6S700_CYLGO|nr:unnamed protein product [Cylicostephanus goldi]
MAAKMVVSMCYIIVLLLVTLMAFGVSRQAITYPHEKWNWLLVRYSDYHYFHDTYNELIGTSSTNRTLCCTVKCMLEKSTHVEMKATWKAFRKGETSEGDSEVKIVNSSVLHALWWSNPIQPALGVKHLF